MSKPNVVLVTGIADYWGRRVAAQLVTNPNLRVIGVDRTIPDKLPAGLDFVQADIRNPLLVELLRTEQVDTVCHLAFMDSRRRNESNFDYNVMGTVKVFGACAEAGVQKIVHRSSTTVYGAQPTNPAFLTEATPLHGSREYGNTRDLIEIEEFCHGFRRQMPHIALTTLRFANIVGATSETPFAKLLNGRIAPMLLGFDPMMQMIHEDDVVAALIYSLYADVPGIYNVAATGLMPLTQILALTQTIPVPLLHPVAYWGAGVLRGTAFNPVRYLPLELDYLRYRWVGDTSHMTTELGFAPHYTAADALRDLVTHKRSRRRDPEVDDLDFDEERLRYILERRQRQKDRELLPDTAVSHDLPPNEAY